MHVDVSDLYQATLEKCLNDGFLSAPRNMQTRELFNFQASCQSWDPVITLVGRKLNYRFMIAEALWILYGRNDLQSLTRFCKRMADFSDDGVTLSGAYGIPFQNQLAYVIRKLLEDEHTRQAVMTLWKPNPRPSKDIPCTVAFQFMIRNGIVKGNVFMRSWDLWLGMPYDLFSFSMMLNYVTAHLNLETDERRFQPGTLTVTAGSAHLYARDIPNVLRCLCDHSRINNDIYTHDFYNPVSLIHHLEARLSAIDHEQTK